MWGQKQGHQKKGQQKGQRPVAVKKKTQQSLPDPPVPTSLAKKKDKLEECQKEKKKKVRMKLSTSWREGHPWY